MNPDFSRHLESVEVDLQHLSTSTSATCRLSVQSMAFLQVSKTQKTLLPDVLFNLPAMNI